MSEALRQVRANLDVGNRTAWLVMLGVLELGALTVSLATRSGALERTAALTAVLLVLLLSARWPMVPLFVFVALIPLEAALFADLGTLSRFAGLLFTAAYAVPRLGRLRWRAMPGPAWIFIAWAILSMSWALDSNVSLTALVTLVQLFAIAVFVADVVVHQPTVVRRLLWVYSVSAALSAVIAIVSYLGGGSGPGGRIGAFQTQDVAQFAAILLPALVFSLDELLHGRVVLASGAIALVTTLGVVLSGTRGAWLSAIVVVVFFILPRLRMASRVAAVGVVVTLLVVALQLPGVSDLVNKRTGNAITTGGAGRTDIWSVATTIIKDSPVIGVGYANFPVAFTPEQIAASEVGNILRNDQSPLGPHSILFGTFAELGIIGLAALAFFLLPLILRRGWGPEGEVVQAALASLLIAALFLDMLNRKQVWLVVGLAGGLAYLARRERRSRADPDTT